MSAPLAKAAKPAGKKGGKRGRSTEVEAAQ